MKLDDSLAVNTTAQEQDTSSQAFREEIKTILSSIPSGLGIYCCEKGQIRPLFHNPAFYDITGRPEKNVLQISRVQIFTGVHEEDLPVLQKKTEEFLEGGTVFKHVFRLFHAEKKEYRWIQVEGTMRQKEDGRRFLYVVYNDINEQVRLEKELTDANGQMQDIINAIPGGVAIYKVEDGFKVLYASDGVPGLAGYSASEYRELLKQGAAAVIYCEDTARVVSQINHVIDCRKVAEFEYRKQHKDGHIVWVRIRVKWIGEEDGRPLLHCVFHDISELKEAQLEMDHLVNSIPGGIASYRVEGNRYIPTYYSDGVMALSGHNKQEYEDIVRFNALEIVYEQDRERVLAAAQAALVNGDILDVSYRIRHKDGHLAWIHLNGRRMGPLSDQNRFYAVFTGISTDNSLFQDSINGKADGIYIIDKENYDLLYANESKPLFLKGKECIGQKCYTALHGRNAPCDFCILKTCIPDGTEHESVIGIDSEKHYRTRFRETDWNGIPAYVKYIRDVTEEENARREKERLEMYFRTVVENLPGGITVTRFEPDGSIVPEYISEEFAAMVNKSVEEIEKILQKKGHAGFYADHIEGMQERLLHRIKNGEGCCELTGRVKRGNKGDIWIKCKLSLLQSSDGITRLYAVYTDITKSIEEQEQIRRQYKELILQHYTMSGSKALIGGHCNITQGYIIDIIDHTKLNLLEMLGTDREKFFSRIADYIVEEKERQAFLGTFLNKPALEAFARGELERQMECFIQLPNEDNGRYVQIKMHMVTTPDSGDVTGIMTLSDITERTIADRILQRLSYSGYDFVIDVDVIQDSYRIISRNKDTYCMPPQKGCYSKWTENMLQSKIVPRDQEQYRKNLNPDVMMERLAQEGIYTFAFSVTDETGDIRTKNMTVSQTDLRLGRVCLARTDITDSIREQQGLLRVIAYTFEMAGFIDLSSRGLSMYTRETVLDNLPPICLESYDDAIMRFIDRYGAEESREYVQTQFSMRTMLQRLDEKPGGYDFLLSYRTGGEVRYKQINVLWGDSNHRTICQVRADVTDMLAAERQTKKNLENALLFAEEANQAKSDFLSAMSHDIRTPMNAIMGMTMLASANLDNRERVEDCLNKISISSRHLLSLINDILDMSKIESANITLNRMKINMPELIEQLLAIMMPQARTAGLALAVREDGVIHKQFYGDSLRINQILINILSNAVKFTPSGGRVEFSVEEIPAVQEENKVRYRFTVRDTGVGMQEEFLAHIFDPFTRNNDMARIEGTGLGLSITKGLVDLMGGEITVESRVNEGSVFRVELECEALQDDEVRLEENPAAKANVPIGGDRFAGYSFLIAEDNAINAEILCELLKMHGAEYLVKTDGEQVVQAFRDCAPGTFDAILMDIQMPNMNGYEATRAIREMKRQDAGDIPIIAMTANAFAEDVQASHSAGMNAHIAKPLDVDLLWETLNKLL